MTTYTTKKPTVGDMRRIYSSNLPEVEIPFKLAECCILKDGQPISEAELNAMPIDEFERLMAEINAEKKG